MSSKYVLPKTGQFVWKFTYT